MRRRERMAEGRALAAVLMSEDRAAAESAVREALRSSGTLRSTLPVARRLTARGRVRRWRMRKQV